MNKKMVTGGLLATVIAAMGAAGIVMAQQPSEPPALSETQAVEIALSEFPGEVKEVELESDDGMRIYEVEIMTAEGKEMEVEIDASNGTILEVEAEYDEDKAEDRKSPA